MSEPRPSVLHVLASLDTGGTESQAVQVARRMKHRGYGVAVACLRKQGPLVGPLEQDGIPVVEFPPRKTLLSLSGIYQLLRLALFIRRGRFSVVHAHDLWANLLAVPAAWLARAPVIICSRRDLGHLAWYTPRRTQILRLIQRLSTVVLANSDAVRQHLVSQNGFAPARIRVIYNAVDAAQFAPARGERARLFPDAAADKLIVCVANMQSKVKGHADLVHAASIVCRNCPEAKFVLVGDGPERPGVEDLVRRLGLELRFLFLGRRQDVPELLPCCDLGVLASTAEGFPNAVLEYMAAGLPVVATRVGGVAEVAEDGVTGLLVSPESPEELAKAILHVLQDPDFGGRLARNGLQRVKKHFSYERILQDLQGLYGVTG